MGQIYNKQFRDFLLVPKSSLTVDYVLDKAKTCWERETGKALQFNEYIVTYQDEHAIVITSQGLADESQPCEVHMTGNIFGDSIEINCVVKPIK